MTGAKLRPPPKDMNSGQQSPSNEARSKLCCNAAIPVGQATFSNWQGQVAEQVDM